jgi:exopolysaccharide biosynthesis polyprenyl glycosylphosphotransferase
VQPIFRRNLLVVGAGWSGRTLAEAVVEASDEANSDDYGTVYNLLGFVDDDPEKQETIIAGQPVLGNSSNLFNLVQMLQPDEIVLAITNPHRIHAGLFQAILDCREKGIAISPMAGLYENLTGKVPIEHAGRDLQVVIPMTYSAGHRVYIIWRRFFDVAIAIPGCLFLLMLLPFVWLFNRFSSPGDLFYRQTRVGMGGKQFEVIKFRSMVMDAEKDTGAIWAAENDSRITTVGRFLRRTRLDEVPQFWNIIKGEMSLIGPRPERPSIVANLAQEIPFYRVRHAVKPGLTGWAQVKYRYGATVNDAHIKLQYDLYYIKYQGIYLDVQICLKTIQVVLGMQGR